MVLALCAKVKGLDIDLMAVAERCIWAAGYHRETASKHFQDAKLASKQFGYNAGDGLNAEGYRDIGMMLASIYPIQATIKDRTYRERERAADCVRGGHAKMYTTSCAGERCDECQRPMWTHVVLDDDLILCPKGRDWATLARAIYSEGDRALAADIRTWMTVLCTAR